MLGIKFFVLIINIVFLVEVCVFEIVKINFVFLIIMKMVIFGIYELVMVFIMYDVLCKEI